MATRGEGCRSFAAPADVNVVLYLSDAASCPAVCHRSVLYFASTVIQWFVREVVGFYLVLLCFMLL